MNKLDKDYQDLLQDILDNGVTKKDRTGTGTISLFGRQIRHKMSDGFPLLTTKKMPFKTIVTELLWFLRGDTNIKYLVDNNCHIWDGDAYKNYVNKEHLSMSFNFLTQEEFINKIKTDDEFAKKWGELGPIYGKQWRKWLNLKWQATDVVDPSNSNQPMMKWNIEQIDQIANLINDLKTNPDSRRLMVSAWNVGEIDSMVLPPCHYGFQVYTRELSAKERTGLGSKGSTRLYDSIKEGNYETIDADIEMHKVCDEAGVPKRAISLMWNQRSVDTFLGLPFNIASYGLLLEIIAKEVNMVPDELIGNLGDTHLYLNHIEQAKEQIGRYFTHEERLEELKKAMGDFYQTAVDEQVPFGGGLSEYFARYGIRPNLHTREPYPLPKLLFKDHLDQFDSIIDILRPIDFVLDNYQSHPTIKAPLSN